MGETCEVAQPVDAGTMLLQQTLRGFESDYDGWRRPGCPGSYGPELADRVYRVEVPAQSSLHVRLISDMRLIAHAALFEGVNECEASMCVGVESSFGTRRHRVVSWTNATTVNRPVWVVVRALDAIPVGTFDIEFLVLPLRANGERCTDPLPLASHGRSDTFSLWNAIDDLQPPAPSSCAFEYGPDRTFALEVPPLSRSKVWLISPTYQRRLSWTLFADSITCGLAQCLSSGSGEAAPIIIDNPGSVPVSRFLAVDGTTVPYGVEPFFHFFVETESIVSGLDGGPSDAGNPRLPGDTCASAETLDAGPGGRISLNLSLEGFENDYSGNRRLCLGEGIGPDRVYVLTLRPGRGVTALLRPNFGAVAGLSMMIGEASCTARLCVGKGQEHMSPAMWQYANLTASDEQVYLVVDTIVPKFFGSVTLDLELFDTDAPAGEDCFLAPPLPSQGVLERQSLYAFRPNFGFGTTLDRVYSLSVPPRSRVRVLAVGHADWPAPFPSVYDSVSDCAARRLGVFSQAPHRQVVVENASGSARHVLVKFEGGWASELDYFSVHTFGEPLP